MREQVLDSGWQLTQWSAAFGKTEGADGLDLQAVEGHTDWVAATVPGLAHEALLAAGKIADPFHVRSHPDLEATFLADYLYRCRFDLQDGVAAAGAAAAGPASLCFDGLDTVATVWLNGHLILRSDNMFVPRECAVGPLLTPRGNTLCIRFESALRVGRERQAVGGARPVWNGDASRVYVRKAQYHYGWDFGPTLLSAGPWRPVRLRFAAPRLQEVHAPAVVAADLKSAQIDLRADISAAGESGLQVAVQLLDPQGRPVTATTQPVPADGVVHCALPVAAPLLWWPRIYGAQPLYTLRVTLQHGQAVCDEQTLRLGLRRLRLLQEPLPGGGESFCFEINNQAIFCGGANWIPADLLNTRVTAAHYRALLGEAVASEMTMLRIWGGGIYEEDTFYDLCDELGILVFQDFMFACGLYPGGEPIAKSVAAEAAAAIKRLRHHPSLVLWAGNNEDYSIAQSTQCYAGPQSEIPAAADPLAAGYKARFDGRQLYEQILPAAVAEHDSGPQGASRPYWPGSPYSRNSADPNAKSEGDCHLWDVWHSPLRPYQEYPLLAGRFVSEFGMQAVPSRATVARALAEPADSPLLTQEALVLLNKGQDGPARIGHYIEQNLPPPRNLDEYLYATQLIQAEALAHAIRGFRRGFGCDGNRAISGALVWQLDDCWPGVSWAMLEHLDAEAVRRGHAVRRKPSFYAVRRELLPLAVAMTRSASGAGLDEPHEVAVWAAQSAGQTREARLVLRAFALTGEQVFRSELAVRLFANQVTELGPQKLPAGCLVVGAQLFSGETLLARAVLWPQPLRQHPLADPEITVERLQAQQAAASGAETLRVRARRPAKAVLLSAGPEARFSDNLLDLLPDEELLIEADALADTEVRLVSLYSVQA